jgi:micrococcal nuclease
MSDPQTRPTFADRYVYAARCVQVIDGDTLDLDIDLGFHVTIRQRVRLRGIDTPELRGKDKDRAVAARTEVTIWTDGVELLIRTELDETDKYGRLLADVWVDGLATSLSDHLVERGMARRYDGGKR